MKTLDDAEEVNKNKLSRVVAHEGLVNFNFIKAFFFFFGMKFLFYF